MPVLALIAGLTTLGARGVDLDRLDRNDCSKEAGLCAGFHRLEASALMSGGDEVLIMRNKEAPHVHPEATLTASASIIGNVEIGARAYVDHSVVIESAGPPVAIGEETMVFAGAVIWSVGGASRPAFPVCIGRRTLVSPAYVLTG